jgi:hypothetical protein
LIGIDCAELAALVHPRELEVVAETLPSERPRRRLQYTAA